MNNSLIPNAPEIDLALARFDPEKVWDALTADEKDIFLNYRIKVISDGLNDKDLYKESALELLNKKNPTEKEITKRKLIGTVVLLSGHLYPEEGETL